MLDILNCNKMGFHQINFYCHKKSVGRVVSIMAKNNTAGQQVVRYLPTMHLPPILSLWLVARLTYFPTTRQFWLRIVINGEKIVKEECKSTNGVAKGQVEGAVWLRFHSLWIQNLLVALVVVGLAQRVFIVMIALIVQSHTTRRTHGVYPFARQVSLFDFRYITFCY